MILLFQLYSVDVDLHPDAISSAQYSLMMEIMHTTLAKEVQDQIILFDFQYQPTTNLL